MSRHRRRKFYDPRIMRPHVMLYAYHLMRLYRQRPLATIRRSLRLVAWRAVPSRAIAHILNGLFVDAGIGTIPECHLSQREARALSNRTYALFFSPQRTTKYSDIGF